MSNARGNSSRVNDRLREVLRALVIIAVVAGLTHRADADTEAWYRGKYGRNRVMHLGLTIGLAAVWGGTGAYYKETFGRERCKWCEPPGFDRAIRNALVWDDTQKAQQVSNTTTYILSPLVGLGLLIASDYDAGTARLIDDLLPIAETVVITQLVNRFLRYLMQRTRPPEYFGLFERQPGQKINPSFPSGHTTFGLAITTSAGLIAHWRHYKTEPYIWAAGITLSAVTAYTRIAADQHYASDVIAGAAVGVVTGLLVPRLMRRDLQLVPVKDGAAVAGHF